MELEGSVKLKLRQLVGSILADIITLSGNEKPEKTAVYLRVYDAKTATRLDKVVAGKIPKDKFGRYKTLSREKAMRLREHPGHLSSYESMNEKLDQWPGAIRAGKKIISASGLTWKGDEALSLQLGIEMGWLDSATAFNIAAISGNGLFIELYHLRNQRAYKSGGRT